MGRTGHRKGILQMVLRKTPYYERIYSLATDVHPQASYHRPYLVLHETDREPLGGFHEWNQYRKNKKLLKL